MARSGITLARANTWTPYAICASAAARSLSFDRDRIRIDSRLISSIRCAAFEPMWISAPNRRYAMAMIEDITPRRSPIFSNSSRARCMCCQLADAAGKLRRSIFFSGQAERGGPAKHDVELQMGIAQRVGQGAELGQALQPVEGPPEHVHGVVAKGEKRDPVLRAGGEWQGHL